MEHNVRTSKIIHIAVCTEGFHHGLGLPLCDTSDLPYRDILQVCSPSTFPDSSTPDAQRFLLSAAPTRNLCLPVLFRMNKYGRIFCFVHVKNRFVHAIFYLDRFNALSTASSVSPATIATASPTKRTLSPDLMIVRAKLWICLTCKSKTFFGNVLIGINSSNPTDLPRCSCLISSIQAFA